MLTAITNFGRRMAFSANNPRQVIEPPMCNKAPEYKVTNSDIVAKLSEAMIIGHQPPEAYPADDASLNPNWTLSGETRVCGEQFDEKLPTWNSISEYVMALGKPTIDCLEKFVADDNADQMRQVFRSCNRRFVENALRLCAGYGKVGHLTIARNLGIYFPRELMTTAAREGQVAAMKFLHENGCYWDEATCENAARNGHLDCLKYAHENNCFWDINTILSAAKFNHADCLIYARGAGCEWDNTRIYDTIKMGGDPAGLLSNAIGRHTSYTHDPWTGF